MLFKSRRRRKKNPARRRRARSHARRRNPSFRRRRSARASARRRNPVYRRRRAKSHARRRNPVYRRRVTTRRRRNPSYKRMFKSGFDPKFLMNAGLTSVGLIVGTKSASLMASLPVVGSAGRFLGAVNLILGGVLAGLVKNQHAKSALVGFAAGGAYNLIASNVSMLNLNPLSGDELLGVEVGGEQPLVALSGVEVSGDGESYVVMGGEGNGSWEGGSW